MKFLAANFTDVVGTVNPPAAVKGLGNNGAEGINNFINNAISLIYIISALAVLFMLLLGAFEMITSGGDKDAVASARKRITYAIVGVVFLSLVFFMLQVISNITGIEFFNITLSSPNGTQLPQPPQI